MKLLKLSQATALRVLAVLAATGITAGVAGGLSGCSRAESAMAVQSACQWHVVPAQDGNAAQIELDEACTEGYAPVVEVAERY